MTSDLDGSAGRLGASPRDEPLTYPGDVPSTSGLLGVDGVRPLTGLAGGVAAARVVVDGDEGASAAGVALRDVPLGEVLHAREAAPMAERTPVLAVGSNASPAQLLAKFRGTPASPVVPLTWAAVAGVRAGVAAFVSRWGYLPAAPVFDPGVAARLAVIWLDDEQLAVVDTTEGGYERHLLRAGDGRGGTVRLESGEPVVGCGIYVSRSGVLAAAADGAPLTLAPQRSIVARLLAAAGHELAQLTGGTAEGFVAAACDPDTRPRLVAMLRSAPGLQVLP